MFYMLCFIYLMSNEFDIHGEDFAFLCTNEQLFHFLLCLRQSHNAEAADMMIISNVDSKLYIWKSIMCDLVLL